MSQRIAGEPTEAMRELLSRGLAERPIEVHPEIIPLRSPIRVARSFAPDHTVTTPGAWERAEPGEAERLARAAQRKRELRAEAHKRRLEAERTRTTFVKIGRTFPSKHPGRCVACKARFGVRTLIAKAEPKGYVHEHCEAPEVVPDPALSQTRAQVRTAIAASRYTSRGADPT